MKRLIVLVDMDDTIEGLMVAWINCINKRHGTSVDPEIVNDWSVGKFFPTLTSEEVYAPLYEDEFWKDVEPLSEAARYLSRLKDDGHEIYIVTATNYQTVKSKMENVLFKYFPFISWNNVIITANKQLINGDILVDDGVHNLIGGSYYKILMDAPHNRLFNAEANDMCRVKNWEEAYKVITEYAEQKGRKQWR